MKKLLLSLMSVGLVYVGAEAQCSKTYVDQTFASFDSVTVTYSTTNQKMIIYTPTGDVSTSRPLLIMAHGGSFIGGDRYEATCNKICQNFAKRGYVTASIDYRLAASTFDMINTSTAYPVVVKAISDAKAAVRYFTKDLATTNTYKIDPNNVYFGGNSAGAIIAVQYAYIDDTLELTQDLRTVMNNNGGIEGNSGNAGYSSQIKAILNLAGGILDTAWIKDATEQPVASFHGDADNTVPFNCGKVLGGASQIALCGSGKIKIRTEGIGVPSVTVVYPGDGHVPWESSTTKFNQVDSVSAAFLSRNICGTVGVREIDRSINLTVYPNPAKDQLSINFNGYGQLQSVKIVDILGKVVAVITPTTNSTIINTVDLSNGVYFVEARLKDNSRAVQKVQILK